MQIPGLDVQWGTGGQFVADRIKMLGLRTLVSLPGSQVLPIWDGLRNDDDITIVVPRTERKGAFIAEGYAMAGAEPPVLMSTLGPGCANELVGIYSASMNNAPVLCMPPYHPKKKRDRIREVFQGLNHPNFFDGVCKQSRVVDKDTGENITRAIDSSLRLCQSDPAGPVRLDLSFPMLFKTSFRKRYPIEPLTYKTPKTDVFLVGETSRMTEKISDSRPNTNKQQLLHPGIDEPGFGIQFALGTKLAARSSSVVAFTTEENLLKNLDVFDLAGTHDIPVQLLDANGHSESIKNIAKTGSAGYKNISTLNDSTIESFQKHTDSLIICCYEHDSTSVN